jgi:sec-independent protein translocase protein TatC
MFFLKQIFRARESLQHPATAANDGAEMGFLEHLEDLRKALIRMVLSILVAMALCFCFAEEMMALLRHPVEGIWAQQEQQYLPAEVSAQHWMQAKQLATLRPELSEQQATALEAQLPPPVPALARTLPLLRAAQLLPGEEAQQDYLSHHAADATQAELALALHASGAKLQAVSERESLRMMGAFQPGEAFMLSLQMAFYGGLVLAFPLLMYFSLGFIVPGLHEHERRLLYKCVFYGFALFLGGCAFAYFAVLPRVLSFFYEYSVGMGIENDWRIGYYLSFAVKLIFVFGVVFELPVILIPLIRLGVLSYPLMRACRGYALVASFAVALVLAPAPDPGTMLLLALPLYGLYELCVLFAWLQHKKERKQQP